MGSSTQEALETANKINDAIVIMTTFTTDLNGALAASYDSKALDEIFPINDPSKTINFNSNPNVFIGEMETVLAALKSVGELQNKLTTELQNNINLIKIQNETSTKLVESESNQVDERIEQLQQDKVSSVRMLEINNYFTERTKAYNQLITIVCGLIIFIIILTTLIKKQIIPSNISNLVLFVVILISVIIILSKLFDIFRRDNMDFNDFRFIDNVKANDPTVIEYNARQLGLIDVDGALDLNTCIGSSCCSEPGLVYDDAIDKCVAE